MGDTPDGVLSVVPVASRITGPGTGEALHHDPDQLPPVEVGSKVGGELVEEEALHGEVEQGDLQLSTGESSGLVEGDIVTEALAERRREDLGEHGPSRCLQAEFEEREHETGIGGGAFVDVFDVAHEHVDRRFQRREWCMFRWIGGKTFQDPLTESTQEVIPSSEVVGRCADRHPGTAIDGPVGEPANTLAGNDVQSRVAEFGTSLRVRPHGNSVP